MALRVAIEQLTGVDRDVAAEGLQLAVEIDKELVILNALDPVDADDGAVHVGVIDLAAEGPACAAGSAGEGMKEAVERDGGCVLHGGEIGAAGDDDLHGDPDLAIDRAGDIELGGEQAMLIE